jgi:hypothetical protein
MQESVFVVAELRIGQTASVLIDDALGNWEITRLRQSELILASPEIPVDAESRTYLLQAVLLENFSEALPIVGRFCMDEERRLRFQVFTSDTELDLAIRNVAQLYAQVVDPEIFRPVDEDAHLDLEQLLAEQSPEDIAAEELSVVLLSQFFATLAQDTDLKNCLVIDASGTQGLIELLGGELPILVIPDVVQKQIFLYRPISLLNDKSRQAEQLEAALLANAMLRIGAQLTLGCLDDLSSLYLRAGITHEQFNTETIKDTLGALLATGPSIENLVDHVEAAQYPLNSTSGVLV